MTTIDTDRFDWIHHHMWKRNPYTPGPPAGALATGRLDCTASALHSSFSSCSIFYFSAS